MSRFNIALDFLTRTVVILIAFEIVTLPLRKTIISTASRILHSIIPGNYKISWECTALDEVFLLMAAILASKTDPRKKLIWFAVGSIALEIYNVLRIAILAVYPSELLHNILFRIGGFAIILLLFYAYQKGI